MYLARTTPQPCMAFPSYFEPRWKYVHITISPHLACARHPMHSYLQLLTPQPPFKNSGEGQSEGTTCHITSRTSPTSQYAVPRRTAMAEQRTISWHLELSNHLELLTRFRRASCKLSLWGLPKVVRRAMTIRGLDDYRSCDSMDPYLPMARAPAVTPCE